MLHVYVVDLVKLSETRLLWSLTLELSSIAIIIRLNYEY